MKTKKQIVDVLGKMANLFLYYWSYVPEFAEPTPLRTPTNIVAQAIPMPVVEAELITWRSDIQKRFNLKPPVNWAQLQDIVGREFLIYQVLNWVVELKDSPLGMFDPDAEPPDEFWPPHDKQGPSRGF